MTLSPGYVVSAGARWSIDGGSSWQSSGATVSALDVGTYTVYFHTIPGWQTPAAKTVIVSNNANTAETGIYTPNQSAISVNLSPPEAVAAGARWFIDSGPSQSSGAILTGFTAGTHTLRFTPAFGWEPPAARTVTLANGTITVETGNYVVPQVTGSLSVTLSPRRRP